MTPSISLCLITKNEELFLAGAIQPLKDFVNEIVVLDTGSTDKTLEIARQLGAKVYQAAWEDDFSKARNLSIHYALSDWILILDADERIALKDIQNFKALTQRDDVLGFSLPSRNYTNEIHIPNFVACRGEYPEYEGSFAGYFETRKIHLFQRHPTIQFSGKLHESVEASLNGNLQHTSIPVHHFGLEKKIREAKSKPELYLELGREKVREHPSDWKAHFELAVAHLEKKQYQESAIEFERAHSLKPDQPHVLSAWAAALIESKNYIKAEEICLYCLRLDPRNEDATISRGYLRMQQSRWSDAISVFSEHLKSHNRCFVALRNRGLCYQHLERYAEAEDSLRQAIITFRGYLDAHIDLCILWLHMGQFEKAFVYSQEVMSFFYRNPRALKIGFEVALRAAQYKKGEEILRHYLELKPHDLYAESQLTTALLYQGKFNEVLIQSEKVLARAPQDYLANFHSGIVHFENRNWTSAEKYLKVALQAQPDSGLIQSALSHIAKALQI